MRPCVGQLESESVTVLHAQSCLERVVVAVGYILNLRDATEPRIDPVKVRVCPVGSNSLPIRHVAEREGIDRPFIVLMPCRHADVLDCRDDGGSHLMLHSQTELGSTGMGIVIGQIGEVAREEWG